MEKRRPHFSLSRFKSVCGDPDQLVLTGSAYRSAAAIGFGIPQVAGVVRSMEARHFFKSMTSYADHRQRQDVYHVPWDSWTLYVKFTDDVLTEFVVLSFKER